MLEEKFQEFEKYANKFDMNEEAIKRKFDHSYRVAKYANEIAKSMNLNESDVYLATLIGLLHDIGRFNQWKIYKTYVDGDSYDHALLGVEVLKENNFIKKFEKDTVNQEIILKAIYYHNKLAIDENLDERTKLHAKIIRDADKLDIMMTQGTEVIKSDYLVGEELIKSIKEHRQCRNQYVQTKIDHVARMLCFIFDLNFKYSLKFVKEQNFIENKLKIMKDYLPDGVDEKSLKEEFYNYINKKLKE